MDSITIVLDLAERDAVLSDLDWQSAGNLGDQVSTSAQSKVQATVASVSIVLTCAERASVLADMDRCLVRNMGNAPAISAYLKVVAAGGEGIAVGPDPVMESITWTRAASTVTRRAIARLIGQRRFGGRLGPIGGCLCCQREFWTCPRSTRADVLEYNYFMGRETPEWQLTGKKH